MFIQQKGSEDVYWISLAQYMDKWRTFVNTVMNV